MEVLPSFCLQPNWPMFIQHLEAATQLPSPLVLPSRAWQVLPWPQEFGRSGLHFPEAGIGRGDCLRTHLPLCLVLPSIASHLKKRPQEKSLSGLHASPSLRSLRPALYFALHSCFVAKQPSSAEVLPSFSLQPNWPMFIQHLEAATQLPSPLVLPSRAWQVKSGGQGVVVGLLGLQLCAAVAEAQAMVRATTVLVNCMLLVGCCL